ncbi:hypothetical protein HY844_00520 [Candidatus Berkelbacteria bacterium]|nr:hypothetical protein [Candidatus Berkelbacteria bacterium]
MHSTGHVKITLLSLFIFVFFTIIAYFQFEANYNRVNIAPIESTFQAFELKDLFNLK